MDFAVDFDKVRINRVFCLNVHFLFRIKSPCLLVHGVFGAEKSYLIAETAIFVFRFSAQVKKDPLKILFIHDLHLLDDEIIK